MGGYYKSVITRDVPYMFEISADELNPSDIFMLERLHHVCPKDFVLVKHERECIVLNQELDNLKEIKELIKKVMRSKYLPDKLFDKFRLLTDEKSTAILARYYSDWRDELQQRELNRQALSILQSAKSLRISWKVKRNRQIIKELFNIGFGIYEAEAICNWQQGAENVFMYGYLLGVQSKKGGVEV